MCCIQNIRAQDYEVPRHCEERVPTCRASDEAIPWRWNARPVGMGLLVPASYRSGRFFLRNGSEREWLNIRNSENDKTLTRFYYSATLLFTLTIQLSVPAISIAQSQYRFQHYDNKVDWLMILFGLLHRTAWATCGSSTMAD